MLIFDLFRNLRLFLENAEPLQFLTQRPQRVSHTQAKHRLVYWNVVILLVDLVHFSALLLYLLYFADGLLKLVHVYEGYGLVEHLELLGVKL